MLRAPSGVCARIFWVALAARLAMFVAIAPWRADVFETRILRLDARLYAEQSEEVLRGRFLSAEAMKAPGYPLLLAAARVFTGGRLVWALVAQLVAGAAVAVLAARLASRFFGPSAALPAGLAVALDPASILVANCLLSDVPFALFVLAGAFALVRALEATGVRWTLAAGVLFALGAAARPIGVVLPLVAVPFLWIEDRRAGRSRGAVVARTAAFFAPWLCGAAAWVARGANPAVFQDAARLASWYVITIEHSSPTKFLRGVVALFFEPGSSLFAELLGHDATRVVLLSDEPGSGWTQLARRAFAGRGALQVSFLVASLAFLALVYLGAARFALRPRLPKARAALACVLAIGAGLAAVSSLWGTMRYRVPILPFVAIASAAGWLDLLAARRARRGHGTSGATESGT